MQTQQDSNSADGGRSLSTVELGGDQRDIVERLRDTPNWLREPWSISWKDLTHKYDRAPFEAADYIERLRTLAQKVLNTRNAEAKAYLSLQNAEENFSDAKPEAAAYERAMLAASAAEKELRDALTTPNVKSEGAEPLLAKLPLD
jgi:hypothetical protein